MREDNLLSLRRKKYVFTTDSAHTLPIYPNLARHAKLTGLNQLWVQTLRSFACVVSLIYLAVVLDATRGVSSVGIWAHVACGTSDSGLTDGA